MRGTERQGGEADANSVTAIKDAARSSGQVTETAKGSGTVRDRLAGLSVAPAANDAKPSERIGAPAVAYALE